MLDFAVKLTENAAAVDESDFERLREAGYSRRAICFDSINGHDFDATSRPRRCVGRDRRRYSS
jgi:hypothetical protein